MKRRSLLVCIAADGIYLQPMPILSRKTIEREGVEQGISEAMCKMVYQEHGCISTGLFEEWYWEVFFPEVQRPREISGYSGDAVLIIDGLTCHESNGFENDCLDNGVCTKLLPSQSRVDMKINVSRIHRPAGLSRPSKQIVRVLAELQVTLLPPTTIHAFAEAGIQARYSTERRCLMCLMGSATVRCVRRVEDEMEDPAECSDRNQLRQRLHITETAPSNVGDLFPLISHRHTLSPR
jgi:hypothetical protein